MSYIYKNVIFTKHGLQRSKDRSISANRVYETINYPDKVKNKHAQQQTFIKEKYGRKYHVVATYKPEQKKYLVISTWVRGEDDRQPIVWQLITAPFRILWWLIKKLW